MDKQQTEPSIDIINDDHFSFSINKEEKTASVIEIRKNSSRNCDEIIIPQSINYRSEDYTITRIKGDIYRGSDVSIHIPSTIIDIGEEFLYRSNNYIKISPNNPRYTLWDNDQLILAKSKIDQSNYDTIIFCSKKARKITIPDFIEIKGPYAFCGCKFEYFDISDNSKLRIIGKFAFLDTNLSQITIPPRLTTIKSGAFLECYYLRKLIYPKDNKSDLHTIEEDAFRNTSIREFTITSNLTNLEDGWCKNTKFEIIYVDENNPKYYLYDNKFVISKSNESHNSLVYFPRISETNTLTIPDFIESIEPYALSMCKANEVVFTNESKIRTIKEYAFYHCQFISKQFKIHW